VQKPDGTLVAPAEITQRAVADVQAYYTAVRTFDAKSYLKNRDALLQQYFTGQAGYHATNRRAKTVRFESRRQSERGSESVRQRWIYCARRRHHSELGERCLQCHRQTRQKECCPGRSTDDHDNSVRCRQRSLEDCQHRRRYAPEVSEIRHEQSTHHHCSLSGINRRRTRV